MNECRTANGQFAEKHGQKGTRLYRVWCAMKERCNITRGSSGKPSCYDHFSVLEIEYRTDGARDICKLVIVNDKTGQIVYSWADTQKRPVQEETAPTEKPLIRSDEPKEELIPSAPSRKLIIEKMCDKLKITTKSFGEYKKAAVANKIIPNKMVNDLSDDEFGHLLNFVEANTAGNA